jgi:hypothetical protein
MATIGKILGRRELHYLYLALVHDGLGRSEVRLIHQLRPLRFYHRP